ncbi:MAG: carboxypeptidase regulatory-like domain-containing protein [marine benthic group bacterium]|nr:carboxypeptidase regulatory-like domain-containing protein [Gemmatimonadota bacterium]
MNARIAVPLFVVVATLLAGVRPLSGQTSGRLIGRAVDIETGAPLAGAVVSVETLDLKTSTDSDGRFLLAGLPSGRHPVSVDLLGYEPLRLEDVIVRAGRATRVPVSLRATAIEVAPLVVEADRIPLIEPEVTESREVIPGSILRELPVVRTEEAVELATGVSDGHFRGGQIGQESYLVDGMEIKNQAEGSTQGAGLEFSPSSLAEIEVITGGFGAEYGSALSGVVSYRTRSGNPERWDGSAAFMTDQWAPESSSAGFSELVLNGGGPLPFLGPEATLFADLQLQGLLDADPRARGLTCIRPSDAGPGLAAAIDSFAGDPLTGSLYCPYEDEALPYQRGDRLIGFVRFDKRFSDGVSIAASVLRNRFQRELYTPELKYNPASQLGQKTSSWYGSATLDIAGQTDGGGKHLAVRVAAQSLDRYLGAVDSEWLEGRSELAGFGLSDFRFQGESFVRLPIETQLDSIVPVPGYQLPQGFNGSPFGPASEGLFTTEGTSGIANWNTSKFVGADIVGELFRANGNIYRGGLTGKLYEVETYERARSWLAGSAPNYARFYPARLAAFGETVLKPGDLFTVSLGLRVEGFRSGLEFSEDRADFLAPVISTDWVVNASPRIGIAGAFENSAGRSAFRVNFARVAQPPDFQYFIDNTIGDSLRTDVRRQGNPNLAFEQGRVFEFGASQLFSDQFGVELTLFYKNLTDIVTGNVLLAGSSPGQYTTGDRGTVKGMELSVRGRFSGAELSIGYALMEATGLTSGARNDSSVVVAGSLAEFPLAFDRRHTIDAALLLGRASPDAARARAEGSGGLAGLPVGAALTARLRSGYPLYLDVGDDLILENTDRLPWTAVIDFSLTWDVARLPGCTTCAVRLAFQGRNLLGRENVIGLRRDSGLTAPTLETVLETAGQPISTTAPIPAESSRYSETVDLDRNGTITADELDAARFGAALDAADPSLFYGESRQLRLGIEVIF